MSTSAYVLYIDESDVGPDFELLRRVCQPRSQSAPHITLRYPIRSAEVSEALYDATTIERIHITGPGAFGSDKSVTPPREVVFLHCESFALEALSYKPDFPNSVFHITVYDGPRNDLSRRVLAVLSEYRWSFDVRMAPRAPSRIEVGQRKPRSADVALSDDALALFRQLAGSRRVATDLESLSEDSRVELVRKICEHIHSLKDPRRKYPSQRAPRPSSAARLQPAPYFQPSLFDDDDGAAASRGLSSYRDLQLATREAAHFLTPPELAHDMVRAALDELPADRRVDFGDPSVGAGIFFASLLLQVKRSRIKSALGLELDEDRAEQTRERWLRSKLEVRTGNFLEADLDGSRSLILANPPYVRSQLLDRRDTLRWAERIRRSTNLNVSGRADLYVYFLLVAHEWLADDGIAGWLIPTEFLQANYGSVLREYLTTCVELLRLHTYDLASPRFENARVSSSFVLFKKRKPSEGHLARVTAGGGLLDPNESTRLDVARLSRATKWSRPYLLDVRNGGRSSIDAPRLDELFEIKRGIATGANDWFVLEHDQLDEFSVAPEWVKPVIPKTRYLSSNVIEADRYENPVVEPRLWLIDTDDSLSSIRKQSPRFARYLEELENEVGHRRLVRDRPLFYRQEDRPAPRFFASYMSRADRRHSRSRFFLNRSRAVILNNYLALYPRPAVLDAIETGVLSEMALLDALAAIGATQLEREGRSYVDGLQKIEPRELSRVQVLHLPGSLSASINAHAR